MHESLDDLTAAYMADRGFPIDVRIPSDLRYIERVVEIVTRTCVALSFSARACNLLVPVALTEALSNAIIYGNGEDVTKAVRVRALIIERALVLEVVDEGIGFEFDSCLHDPTDPLHLDREDGRGLFLMTRLMDRVERFSDGGNVVRLTLRQS
ncbi:MAG: ATP-binding protein [Gemmatimonadaceae bacterium]|nr:ATP-binding protein [Gemmatimonadaceae bacterium]